jgi:YbbR domain-containing protein
MRQFFQRYVVHNFGLKFLSLLIAIGLWYSVAHDPVAEIAINVPIELHNIPDNLVVSSEVIPQAQIRVRGPARVIRQLQPEEIHPIIDLTGVVPGEKTFDLTAHQIHLPGEADVVQVVPSHLRISFDYSARKQVEVKPRVTGSFASGYRIVGAQVEPSQVEIVGPAQRVKLIENAITDPVDATGVMGRASFTTNVYIPDPLVRLVKPAPVRVTVITEKTSTVTEKNPAITGVP